MKELDYGIAAHRVLSGIIDFVSSAVSASKKRRKKSECEGQAKKLKRLSRKEKNQADLLLSDYYFEGGLRKVYPYFYTWFARCKQRWFKRTLFDVYSSEFSRSIMGKDLRKLITTGRITVNGKTVSPDYILKNGDILEHVVHRHEAPVLAKPLTIVGETKDYIAFNKPCSIPVHPCGKYLFNSVTSIIAKEFNYSQYKIIHRLDRATSGLLLFAKNSYAAQRAEALISGRNVEKTYICKVDKEFPLEGIEVNQPIKVVSFKHGLCRISKKDGKSALTYFERYDESNPFIVKCKPLTGRLHQIRVHLQYLGFPIENDIIYNNPEIWGPSNGLHGEYDYPDDKVIANFSRLHSYELYLEGEEYFNNGPHDPNMFILNSRENNTTDDNYDNNPHRQRPGSFDPECFECRNKFKDPSPDDMILHLHAYRYVLDGNTFTAPLPDWVKI